MCTTYKAQTNPQVLQSVEFLSRVALRRIYTSPSQHFIRSYGCVCAKCGELIRSHWCLGILFVCDLTHRVCECDLFVIFRVLLLLLERATVPLVCAGLVLKADATHNNLP